MDLQKNLQYKIIVISLINHFKRKVLYNNNNLSVIIFKIKFLIINQKISKPQTIIPIYKINNQQKLQIQQ